MIRIRPAVSGTGVAGILAGALVLAACATVVDEPSLPPAPVPAPVLEDPVEPPAAAVLEGRGVTAEGCAQPAGGRATPGNGCISLGVLAGLTLESSGEFGPLAQRAVVDFWARVNATGGIGGLDVDVETFARDTGDDPDLHLQRYREMAPDVLLIAHSWGTSTTLALREELEQDRMFVAPVSDWSGLHFSDVSPWMLSTSAHSACLAPMLGLDWFVEQGRPVEGVFVVVEPGLSGDDVVAGARTWSERNDVAFLGASVSGRSPVTAAEADAVTAQILESGADVVLLGVDPATTAEIAARIAGSAPLGSVLMVGVGRSWSTTALQTPAAAALIGLYTHVAAWEDHVGDAVGHAAMREAFGSNLPINSGYATGWIGQYPVKALLEAMVASGDASPEGLVRLIPGLRVSYEGILPDRQGGAVSSVTVDRSAVVGRVNPESENGLDTVAEGYRGTTAAAFDHVAPCAPAGP